MLNTIQMAQAKSIVMNLPPGSPNIQLLIWLRLIAWSKVLTLMEMEKLTMMNLFIWLLTDSCKNTVEAYSCTFSSELFVLIMWSPNKVTPFNSVVIWVIIGVTIKFRFHSRFKVEISWIYKIYCLENAFEFQVRSWTNWSQFVSISKFSSFPIFRFFWVMWLSSIKFRI